MSTFELEALVLLIRHNMKKWIRYWRHDVRKAHGRLRSCLVRDCRNRMVQVVMG